MSVKHESDTKHDVGITHSEDVTTSHGHAAEDERPWYKQPELRTLYLMMPFLFLGSTTLGYDGSLLNGLQTMPAWKECTYCPSQATLSKHQCHLHNLRPNIRPKFTGLSQR
jgi:hypothetical protein